MNTKHGLMINTFKPKVVDMHSRDHLERFRDACDATGSGLGWPIWRFSVEIGSKIYLDLIENFHVLQGERSKF